MMLQFNDSTSERGHLNKNITQHILVHYVSSLVRGVLSLFAVNSSVLPIATL